MGAEGVSLRGASYVSLLCQALAVCWLVRCGYKLPICRRAAAFNWRVTYMQHSRPLIFGLCACRADLRFIATWHQPVRQLHLQCVIVDSCFDQNVPTHMIQATVYRDIAIVCPMPCRGISGRHSMCGCGGVGRSGRQSAGSHSECH